MTKEHWLSFWKRGLKYAVYQDCDCLKASPLQPPQVRADMPVQLFHTLGEAWEYAYGHKPTFHYNMQDEGYDRETDNTEAEETL